MFEFSSGCLDCAVFSVELQLSVNMREGSLLCDAHPQVSSTPPWGLAMCLWHSSRLRHRVMVQYVFEHNKTLTLCALQLAAHERRLNMLLRKCWVLYLWALKWPGMSTFLLVHRCFVQDIGWARLLELAQRKQWAAAS